MTTSNTLQENAPKVLKNLIHLLHDGQEGFKHASENVQNPQLKALFSKYSLQRSRLAGELQAELRSYGESDPQKEGTSISGAIHRGWIDLKGAFSKNDEHAILSEAERGEDVAKKAYRDALEDQELPATLRQIIARQAKEIQAAHDEVKALRDATKK